VHTTFSQDGLRRYPNLIKGMEPEGPNHIWCGDITYIRLRSEFLYLAVLMDIFTRAIRGWHLSHNLTEELVRIALERALATHPAPRIHHSDEGVQYAARGYIALLQARGTQISMATVGRPTENAYAERLIRTVKDEEVYLHEYEDCDDAYQRIGQFLEDVYMSKRVHSALEYLTPAEIEVLQVVAARA
jgi:putative transposase